MTLAGTLPLNPSYVTRTRVSGRSILGALASHFFLLQQGSIITSSIIKSTFNITRGIRRWEKGVVALLQSYNTRQDDRQCGYYEHCQNFPILPYHTNAYGWMDKMFTDMFTFRMRKTLNIKNKWSTNWHGTWGRELVHPCTARVIWTFPDSLEFSSSALEVLTLAIVSASALSSCSESCYWLLISIFTVEFCRKRYHNPDVPKT